MKVRKITSLLLCAAITANLLVSSASAYSEAGESRVYTYNGYTVEYKIVNEWTGNQNIEITVTNTGDEILADWAMGYNASGEINGLWNAQVYAVQGTEYILKGADYNSEIAPGKAVRFGYILSGEEFKYPQNIFNCAKRVDISDDYDVYYNITGDYGDTYQAEMTLVNLSDTDYSAWQLSFEGNATIDNLWNAKLLENDGGSFKVKNAEHNSVICAGDSVSFNFSGTKLFKDDEETSYIAGTSEAQTVEATEESQPDITDESENVQTETSESTEPQTDESANEVQTSDSEETSESDIESAETDEVQTGEPASETQTTDSDESKDTVSDTKEPDEQTSEIFVSDGTAEPYEAEVEYTPMNASVEANSDVVFDNYRLTAVVIPMEFDFEFDPELDSDGDGLPDYIERGLGLDRNNPDTDGDGLPDGYEYYYLGTDPAKVDTDGNGVSDADEDFDEDGLTNIEEYERSTNPFAADTDRDGLSDYDEVYNYNTDPTNPDTDGDKVTDGDEIILGLDPNDPATNGYPDSEYTTAQTVGTDSGALDYINSLEENPYTISVEVTAAGVADNCLSADESGYSNVVLQNDAVLGVVPELTYSEGLLVTDVIINFNLDDSAVDNELGIYDDPAFKGINRFSVFKYFEDNNVLLPIETFYNEDTNTVYTHVDVMGTYCLIDMEKWLNNIENAPKGNYYEESDNEPANIVFCLDTRDIIDSESFDDIKANIKAITDDAFGRYDDIKVYIYYQRFGSNFKVTNNLLGDPETGEDYFTCYEDAEAALDRLERYLIRSSFWAYDYVEATQFMIDTCDENIIAMYHITADDRVMGSVSGAKKLLQTVQNSKYTTRDEEEINRIYVSLLCPNSDKVIDPDSYAAQLVEASGGVIYTMANPERETTKTVKKVRALSAANDVEDEEEEPLIKPGSFADTVRYNVTGILGDGNEHEYTIISSTGKTTIKLDKPLTKGSTTDTDHDGLYDWNEVNTDLIIKILAEKNHGDINLVMRKWKISTQSLPSYGDIHGIYEDLFYVKDGLSKWLQASASSGDPYRVINGQKVLPIISNPVDADSDNDGIPDFCDLNRLIKGDVFDDMDTISHPRSDHNNDTFTVVSEFSCPMIFKRQPYNQINVYSLPKQTSKMPFVYSYSSNENIHAYAVVKNTDGYWIKVMNKNNGKMGYVKWGNRNIIDEFSVVNNVINRFETKTTKLLLSHDDIVNALIESKCLKGDESIDNINSKLLKTTYEDGGAFSYESAPYGVIKNSEFAYLDKNDLYRVEMSNKIDNVDFYTVAISDQLMKTAYDSLMESIPDTLTKSRDHYGGFRFLVKLVGDNGEMRYINMISSDAKSDLKWTNDKDEGNSLFPVSRDRNGVKLYCNDGSVEYHDHLFEFVVNNRPNDDIVIKSNVDYDKLLGVPSDTNLKVYEVYLYIDEPLVAGVWGGYYDYDKYIW